MPTSEQLEKAREWLRGIIADQYDAHAIRMAEVLLEETTPEDWAEWSCWQADCQEPIVMCMTYQNLQTGDHHRECRCEHHCLAATPTHVYATEAPHADQ